MPHSVPLAKKLGIILKFSTSDQVEVSVRNSESTFPSGRLKFAGRYQQGWLKESPECLPLVRQRLPGSLLVEEVRREASFLQKI